MYKGTILFPPKFKKEHYITDRYDIFLNKLAKELNWKIVYRNDINEKQVEGEYLLAFKCPQHDDHTRGLGVLNLPKNIKVILYHIDLQKNDYKEANKLLKRADAIICPYNEAFKNKHKKYIHKYHFFPHFVNIESFNVVPPTLKHYKCLLVDHTNKFVYPVRYGVMHYKNIIDVIDHPQYGDQAININDKNSNFALRDNYIKKLKFYFCAITDCSSYNYVLAKYFEIPAAKTLLIANECKDLGLLGFIPEKHYIKLEKDNTANYNRIKEVLQNNKNYDNIINDSYELVLNNHTAEHRIERFKQILQKI